MDKENIFTYKLLMLYIMDGLAQSFTPQDVIEIFVKLELLNAFSVGELYDELLESGLIVSSEKNRERCVLSSDGVDTLESFLDSINSTHKNLIDTELSIRKHIDDERRYSSSNYYKVADNMTKTELYFKDESGEEITISLRTSTNSDAEIICDNWDKYAREIQAKIMEMLRISSGD